MGQIFGVDGYEQLKLGYPTHIEPGQSIRPGVVTQGSAGISIGDVLVTTATTKSYEAAVNLAGGTITDESSFIGFCLSPNAKTTTTFITNGSTSGKTTFNAGERLDVFRAGKIAVEFEGGTPLENGKVYLCTNGAANENGKISADANVGSARIELTNCKFAGVTEGNLTVVEQMYAR